jgi:hypothetical protein
LKWGNLALASTVAPTRPAIVAGGAFAFLVVFVCDVLFERYESKEPNSLPFFFYIALFAPLACAGILIARYVPMICLSKREFVSGLLTFIYGALLGTVLILINVLLGFRE